MARRGKVRLAGGWSLATFLLALLGPVALVLAADPAQQFEVEAEVEVREDRTYRAKQTTRTRILSEAGLAAAQGIMIVFIDGLETLDMTAAAIERGGETIAVDVSKIERRPPGPGQQSDQRTLVLAFPDAKVGDTLVYSSVRDVNVAAFAGHFTYAWTFARTEPWSKARYVISAPSRVPLQVEVTNDGGQLRHLRDEPGEGRVRHTFTFERGVAGEDRPEAGSVAALDRDPSFAITTFSDVADFAAAYWRAAAPQTQSSSDIAALAAEIVRGAQTAQEMAVAIDRWMKRNIRYVARYLGRERWVPAPAVSVLRSRVGDCKDHAVLMSALLSAAGLASEHVLINLGTSYGLPRLPPAGLNHVMVYVPDAGLTLDPSVPLAAPGVLSVQAYDKPSVHVGPGGPRVSRTPTMAPHDHATSARTSLLVAANGAISGETEQTARGIFATSARQAMLRIQAEGPVRVAEQRLAALGTAGSGRFEASSPSEVREPYVVKATFVFADLADLPLVGHRRLPIGLPIHARPGQFLLGPRLAGRKHPFVCFAGTQREDIAITFADGLALPRVPQPKRIAHPAFTYEATASLEARTFRVTRVFTSQVAGQVCPPALEAEIEEPLKEVIAHLGTMLTFSGSGATGSVRKRP